MALLGAFIDSRTNAALTSGASSSFAHGLPAAPDMVYMMEVTTAGTNVSAVKLCAVYDATNVSIFNHGEGASQALRVVSLLFHSTIR